MVSRASRGRASRDLSPGGPETAWCQRPFAGWPDDRLGLCDRVDDGARHAGIRRAQRFRRRSALRVPQRGTGAAAQEPGSRHRCCAERRARQPDAGVAGVLCPLLARGVPVADDGSPRSGSRTRQNGCGRRTSRRGAGPGPWCGAGVAAQRQLGYGGGVAGPDSRHVHHRGRAAQTRVAVPAVHQLSGEPGLRGNPAVGRRAAALPAAQRTTAGQQGCVSDGRARPFPQRGPGEFLRRTDQDASRFGEAGDHNRGGAAAGALLVRGRRDPDRDLPAAGLHQRRRRRHHPGAGRHLCPQHRRVPRRLAYAAAAVAGRSVRRATRPIGGGLMRIGMVCPYSFDVPGGVQSHVLQLAEVMRARGQNVSVLAPSSPHVALPEYVGSAGRAVPIPYNGSVARLQFSPAVHGKVRRWLAEGDFDVLHLHEPNAPSLSMWALRIAEGPIVATFHTSTTKSLTLSVVQGLLRPLHERIVGRIAVSDLARRWQMEALGSDAVEIPNGVDVASLQSAPLLDGYPRPAKTVVFLGRYDEPRKGMAVLVDALPGLVERFPGVQVLVVGRGDEDELRSKVGALAGHLRFLGLVDDAAKASAQRSADVYSPPHPGGGRFGIVLVEAMAAGTPVVANDLHAFRRVLRDGQAGRLVAVDDSAALAEGLIAVLENDPLAKRYAAAGAEAVRRYDWSVVASQVMRVYETVAVTGNKVQVAS